MLPFTSTIDNFLSRAATRSSTLATGVGRAKSFYNENTMDQLAAKVRRPFTEARLGRRIAKLEQNDKPWMLFDLDETLTYARPDKAAALPDVYQNPGNYPKGTNPLIREWSPWQRYLSSDVPEPDMVSVYNQIRKAGTHNVGILTARSERARPATSRWLRKQGMMPDALIMRPITKDLENMSSGPYKTAMIDRLMPNARVEGFWDDSGGVISAMEERGITATRVTPKELPDVARTFRRRRSSGGRGFRA